VATPEPQEASKALYVNGSPLDEDDLTFREKREMRRVILEDLMGDAKADISEAYTDDFLLAMLYIVLKRDQPEMTVEDALDLKLSDFLKAPPTKAAAKK
jgi:hypothetical protein